MALAAKITKFGLAREGVGFVCAHVDDRSLLTEMGFGYMVKSPTRMIGDNQNATNWAVENMITEGNKHIDM